MTYPEVSRTLIRGIYGGHVGAEICVLPPGLMFYANLDEARSLASNSVVRTPLSRPLG